MAPQRPRPEVSAWRPRIPGVVEVFHAHFTEYAYPMHVHEAWTLLIVDDGAVRYDLDRHEHGTPHDTVSLLPPHVPHNGSPATPHGFRKRVLYLDDTHISDELIGAAVDQPDLRDPVLRLRVGQLHTALALAGDELEAESRLTLVGERLRSHLRPRTAAEAPVPTPCSPAACANSSTSTSSTASPSTRPRDSCTPIPPIWYARSVPPTASPRTSTSTPAASTAPAGSSSTAGRRARSPPPPGSSTSPISPGTSGSWWA